MNSFSPLAIPFDFKKLSLPRVTFLYSFENFLILRIIEERRFVVVVF
jgi:hypothetical protein